MKKRKGVHPVFKSKIKCIDTYKGFVGGVSYEITGFGKRNIEGKNIDIWFIKALNNDQEEFSVIKTTVNVLVDNGILKEIYE